MSKRTCRNPHSTDGLTEAQVIELAMTKLLWSRQKVISWYNKENPSLKKARPRELVERGDTDKIVEFLNKREADRLAEDSRRSSNTE
jgi:hypothetical protein